MKSLLWVLHGPNLNLLGSREPGIYGHTTLADINRSVTDLALQSDVAVECFQSNHEGQLIDQIHKAPAAGVGFVVINPGAFTHTSVAIRDALAGVAVPFIEVHLSNVHKREPFRHHSYFSDLATAVVVGMGPEGYLAATRFAVKALSASQQN